jgi:hypothetical protein
MFPSNDRNVTHDGFFSDVPFSMLQLEVLVNMKSAISAIQYYHRKLGSRGYTQDYET